MLLNCGVGELLRVPWTARRSNQSILKEISPRCSPEELMLKLKLQYFGHLTQRADSLEKTLMLGKTEGKRRKGWQGMRWLDGITDSNEHDSEQTLGDSGGQKRLACCDSWGHKVSDTTEWLTELNVLFPHPWIYATVSLDYSADTEPPTPRWEKLMINNGMLPTSM